ncbi:hypothetical protein ACHAQA_002305 [Verticillium albo-atrum]
MEANENKSGPLAKRQKTKDTRSNAAQGEAPAALPLLTEAHRLPDAADGKRVILNCKSAEHQRESSAGDSSGDDSEATAIKNPDTLLRYSLPRKLSHGSRIVINRMHLNFFKVMLRTAGSIGLAKFGLGLPGDLIGRLDEDNLPFVFARTSTENTRHTLLMKLHSLPCLTRIEPESRHILELGAGSGIWASEMAARCERVGTQVHAGDNYDDLLTLEPAFFPPNLNFVNMDIVHGPPVGSHVAKAGTMDMIRISHAIAHVTDRKNLLDTCYSSITRRALNNGGYLEIQAFEPMVRKRHEPENFDHPLNTFFRLLCREIIPDLSRVDPLNDLVASLNAAGFVGVEVMSHTVPIGIQEDVGWMKRRVAGALFRHVLHDYISHIDRGKFALRGLNNDQIDTLVQLSRDAIDAKDNQHYMRLVFISARKPCSGWDDATTDMDSDSGSEPNGS